MPRKFQESFEKLSKKKPYKSLEPEIIEYFFDKKTSGLVAGIRLNNSETEPYIKKRLEGKGGFRFYFLIIIKNDNLYLMFVHPKTGPDGADNIDDKYKAYIYKDALKCIKTNDLYLLTLDKEKGVILFHKIN